MRTPARRSVSLFFLFLAACGGSAPDAKSPATAPESSPTPPSQASAASDAPAPDKERVKIVVADPGQAPRRPLRYVFHAPRRDTMVMDMRMTMQLETEGRPAPKVALPLIRSTLSIESAQVLRNGDLAMGYAMQSADVLPEAGDPPQVVDLLKSKLGSLVGLTGQMEVTSRGGAVRADVTIPPKVDPQVADMMQQMNDSMRDIQVPLPDEAVGRGARWTATTAIKMRSIAATREATYVLTSIDGDHIELDAEIALHAKPQMVDAPGLPAGATMMLESMKGGGTGHLTIDLQAVVPTSKSHFDNDSSMVVTAGAQVQRMRVRVAVGLRMAPGQ